MEQEMDFIMSRENTKERFVNAWRNFVPAIVSYGRKATKKSVVRYLFSFDQPG